MNRVSARMWGVEQMYEDIEKVYLLHYHELYRYFLKLGADRSIVDDLIQVTFLQALKNIESFNGKSALKTWMFSIARNQLYSYYRSLKLNIELEDIMPTENVDLTDKLMAEDILRFIDTLTPPVNEILRLRLLFGYSFKEIGEKVGQTENYCRVIFYRAKDRLRKEFHYE